MLQMQNARSSGTQAEAQGLATKEQIVEQGMQPQPPSAQEEAMRARAAKDQALAAKHQLATQVSSQFGNPAAQQPQQQAAPEQFVDVNMQQQIQMWAGELLSMNDGERRQYLSAIQAQSPELAQAVVEVAGEMEQGGAGPAPGQPAVSVSSDPAAMVQALMTEAKSPEELAQRLAMIDARQQSKVLAEIQRRNPQLFMRVMQLLNAERMKTMSPGGGGGGSVVDMKPLPEQGPPRREDSPV
jgi:hypothetical protein